MIEIEMYGNEIRKVRYLSFRQRDKSRCHLPLAVACCLQPATSPRETFGFQRGAAETLHSRVFGAYHQRKAGGYAVPWPPLTRGLSPKVTEGENPCRRTSRNTEDTLSLLPSKPAVLPPSFSSRASACSKRDQPPEILWISTARCRNPLRGSSVRIIRGRQGLRTPSCTYPQ